MRELSVRRALGRVLIPDLVRQGLGYTSIERFLFGEGVSYRRGDMQADVRLYSGRHKLQGAVEAIDHFDPLPRGVFLETELAKPRNYRVYGIETLYNEDTDEYVEQVASAYMERADDKPQVESDFIDGQVENPSRPGWQVVGFEMTSGEHNRGYDW